LNRRKAKRKEREEGLSCYTKEKRPKTTTRATNNKIKKPISNKNPRKFQRKKLKHNT